MKAIFGSAMLTVSLATCGVQQAPEAVSVAHSKTFQSSDAKLVVNVPPAWHVEDNWPDATTFLTNFRLGDACCHLREGQIKIDVFRERARTSSMRELFATRCGSGRRSGVYDCQMVSANGRQWAWVYTDDLAGDAFTTLTAVTLDGAAVVSAVAFVPGGDAQPQSIEAVEGILRTIEIR